MTCLSTTAALGMTLLVATLSTPSLAAQAAPAATPEVFRRYGDRVLKIQVVESGSAAKAELGSGFYVSADGHIVTNFHVVSKVVHDPDRYRAELAPADGAVQPVTVLAVDVVHDLAVLRADARPARWFALGATAVRQGERLYALGHPHDLGLSIVEGTYNGLLQHTLYPKIHFTGSINPGMSGGPTVTEGGTVVGINVSTAGNQVSFLVPVDRAVALVDSALRPGYAVPQSFLPSIARQLRDYQNTYLAELFARDGPSVTLGPYRLPTQPAPFFKCWADADRSDEEPYQVVDHQCSTDDYVFLSAEQSSGIVEVRHRLLASDELNAIRFHALYQATFAADNDPLGGSEREVTGFRCRTAHVRQGTLKLRTAFCLRGYKRLAGLYDAVVKAAALGQPREGLLTTLTLSGVSFENAQAMARRFLESIAWTE